MPSGLTLLKWEIDGGYQCIMEVQFRDKSPNVELCAVILPLLLCGQCLVGGLWRAPVFPARPLVWGPCTLRTLCVTRTPQDKLRSWAFQNNPEGNGPCRVHLVWLPRSVSEKGWGNIPSNWTQEKPAHHTQGYTQRYKEKHDTMFLSLVLQALWLGVHTCDSTASSMQGGLCPLSFFLFFIFLLFCCSWMTVSEVDRYCLHPPGFDISAGIINP